MKGFQIIINNDQIINLNCFYSNIVIHKSENSCFLIIQGGDELKNRFKWKTLILSKGDKISIKVLNLNVITLPTETKSADIISLKKEYEAIKLELQNKGLI